MTDQDTVVPGRTEAGPDAAGAGGAYEYLCELGELTVGQPAQAQVGEAVLAVVRTGPREVHAIDDRCTHGNVSLSEGEVDGCTLECWLHGSRFDLRSGMPLCPPATVPVAVHDVRLDGERVLVSTIPRTTTIDQEQH